MKLTRYAMWAALSAAVLTAASCSKAPPRPAPPPPKVNVGYPVVRPDVEYDSYTGAIGGTEEVQVRSRVRGHIYKVGFSDGDLVKKDQIIFELDPRPFEANVARAKDDLKVFEAQVNAAKKEEARLKDLQSKGGSSQSQVDKAEADRISLEAQVEGAKQEVKRQELDLEYSKITAPIAGRIGQAKLTVGNLVNAGGTDPILAEIIANEQMYVYFDVDQKAMNRYIEMNPATGSQRSGNVRHMNLPIEFSIGNAEFAHKAIIDFVNNKVDKTSGTIKVRAVTDNSKGIYVPGAYVKVRFPVGAPRSVSLVPDTAIQSDQDRKYVLIVDDKKVVHRRDIHLGRLLDDGLRIVLPGDKGPAIAANEWVIMEGIQMARINYPVDPIPLPARPVSTAPVEVKPPVKEAAATAPMTAPATSPATAK